LRRAPRPRFFGVREGRGLFEGFSRRADRLGEPVLIELGRLCFTSAPDVFGGDGDRLEARFRKGERRVGVCRVLRPICCRVWQGAGA